MAYNKKYNYPSLKKPGVYITTGSASTSEGIKLLGLDNDNLEKFSLGSWEEYKRNDVQILYPYDLGTTDEVIPLPDFFLEDLPYGSGTAIDLRDETDLIVSAQAMRYSPDGTKLFVLTRQVSIDTILKNDQINVDAEITNAKQILTYELTTPFDLQGGYELISTVSFENYLEFVPVDFYISEYRLIFLQNNQGTDYSPTSQCQLKSFVLVNPFDVTAVEADPITIELTDQTNAKSFDITDSGNQLFVLYGSSPIYQTTLSDDTGTASNKWGMRFNDEDYVQGFNLTAPYDISTLGINTDNKREIFIKNPNRGDDMPADTSWVNRSNNLRYIRWDGFEGSQRDWSGLATEASVPPAFTGEPLTNPIFMPDEPWFKETQGSYGDPRELGAICPRVVRFHPNKQKMFITGLIPKKRFEGSETANSVDSYTVKSGTDSMENHVFQYDFDSNYDIMDSKYTTRKQIGGSFASGWGPYTENYGFAIVFFDELTDPKVSFLSTRYAPTHVGSEEPSRLVLHENISLAIQVEEENLELYNELFVNTDSEFYQKFESLINIPPNTEALPFTASSDETFEVHTFTNNTDLSTIPIIIANDKSSFIYHDAISDNYTNTSYPVKVFLGVNLLNSTTGDDTVDVGYIGTPRVIDWQGIADPDSGTAFDIGGTFPSNITSNDTNFKFKVIQWGDEKTLLTNEQIINSEYFINYDEDSNLYKYKRFFYTQRDFISMRPNSGEINLISHVYNEPGVKSIKIIVTRFSKNNQWILETSLITKNIVINDGTLLSQDFSTFGGTDFNFLPLSDKEAIIGGLDDDSKYNNSVEKIKKDDNFIIEDYLERVSSREFINNFNKKLYGETPGQLDLSTTRMYKKPLDIYDFINADKLKWITQGSGSLPINSSATDIFISNEDCIVDLNPQDMEYLSIQNKTGIPDKAILIGDYKVNQPKDGRVQKQGVMQTPLLEQNTDKQAF